MSLVPYLLAYAGIAVFLIAVAGRVLMFARMPVHLRWELYPVPHEGKRAAHGGSYLEDVDWWAKPRHKSHLAEFRAMATEILFLEALHKHNRPMWRSSFPFHFGLYLVIAATVLMGIGAVVGLGGLNWVVVIAGAVGLGIAILGALGLLRRRLFSSELADYTTGADLFNLGFFVVAFGFAFVTFAVYDRDFALVSRFIHNLVIARMEPVAEGAAGAMVAVSAGLLTVLLAYIPLTHMSHFVGKWFAYHAIRWNDTPNLRGGAMEAPIVGNLMQKVTWAAPHIQSQGEKNWVDVATMDFKKYGEKK